MTTGRKNIEKRRRRKRLFWLCIAGWTGALTLVAPALFVVVTDGLSFPGIMSLPHSSPLVWYQVLWTVPGSNAAVASSWVGAGPAPTERGIEVLEISALLGIGPMLSTLICWHFIVNRARRVTWLRGLVAGLLASVLAYPLTAIVAAFLLNFSTGVEIQLSVLPGLLLLTPLISLFLLPSLTGVSTSLLGIILGTVLGRLQGHDEAKLRR